MATLNLGRIKPVFRGAYSGSTAYVVDDIVTHGNESFICIQAHGAGTQATSVTAYWTKLATKGTDGTDVGTTITTQGDILYRDGSGLQRLASSGHGSKTLQMNSGATAPEWVTVTPPTSDFVKIANITATSGSTVEIDGHFSGTYENYKIVINDWVPSTASDAYLRVVVGGSIVTASEYNSTQTRTYTDTSPSNQEGYYGDWDSVTYWTFSRGDGGSATASEGCLFGDMDIYKPLNTTQWKHIKYAMCHNSNGNTMQYQYGHLGWKNTAAISGLSFYQSSGTITNFDATIYGIKS